MKRTIRRLLELVGMLICPAIPSYKTAEIDECSVHRRNIIGSFSGFSICLATQVRMLFILQYLY